MQISSRSIETKLGELRDRHEALGDELRSKAIEHNALGMAIGIVQEILAPDQEPIEAEAAPVRKPRRLADKSAKPAAKAEPTKRRPRVTGNESRNAEVVRLHSKGVSAKDIAAKVKMYVPGVYGILKRHKESQTASEGDDADDGPAGESAAEQPPRKTKPPIQIEPYESDLPDELTPTEMQMAVNRVEKIVSAAKKMTAEQICNACKLKPEVFAEVAKLARIVLVDGGYVMTRRF